MDKPLEKESSRLDVAIAFLIAVVSTTFALAVWRALSSCSGRRARRGKPWRPGRALDVFGASTERSTSVTFISAGSLSCTQVEPASHSAHRNRQ